MGFSEPAAQQVDAATTPGGAWWAAAFEDRLGAVSTDARVSHLGAPRCIRRRPGGPEPRSCRVKGERDHERRRVRRPRHQRGAPQRGPTDAVTGQTAQIPPRRLRSRAEGRLRVRGQHQQVACRGRTRAIQRRFNVGFRDALGPEESIHRSRMPRGMIARLRMSGRAMEPRPSYDGGNTVSPVSCPGSCTTTRARRSSPAGASRRRPTPTTPSASSPPCASPSSLRPGPSSRPSASPSATSRGVRLVKRREYTVLGDSVNLAARLMQRSGTLVAKRQRDEDPTSTATASSSARSFETASAALHFEFLGEISVKGKSEKIRTFHLLPRAALDWPDDARRGDGATARRASRRRRSSRRTSRSSSTTARPSCSSSRSARLRRETRRLRRAAAQGRGPPAAAPPAASSEPSSPGPVGRKRSVVTRFRNSVSLPVERLSQQPQSPPGNEEDAHGEARLLLQALSPRSKKVDVAAPVDDEHDDDLGEGYDDGGVLVAREPAFARQSRLLWRRLEGRRVPQGPRPRPGPLRRRARPSRLVVECAPAPRSSASGGARRRASTSPSQRGSDPDDEGPPRRARRRRRAGLLPPPADGDSLGRSPSRSCGQGRAAPCFRTPRRSPTTPTSPRPGRDAMRRPREAGLGLGVEPEPRFGEEQQRARDVARRRQPPLLLAPMVDGSDGGGSGAQRTRAPSSPPPPARAVPTTPDAYVLRVRGTRAWLPADCASRVSSCPSSHGPRRTARRRRRAAGTPCLPRQRRRPPRAHAPRRPPRRQQPRLRPAPRALPRQSTPRPALGVEAGGGGEGPRGRGPRRPPRSRDAQGRGGGGGGGGPRAAGRRSATHRRRPPAAAAAAAAGRRDTAAATPPRGLGQQIRRVVASRVLRVRRRRRVRGRRTSC